MRVEALRVKHEADSTKFAIFCAVIFSAAVIIALANNLKCIVCS